MTNKSSTQSKTKPQLSIVVSREAYQVVVDYCAQESTDDEKVSQRVAVCRAIMGWLKPRVKVAKKRHTGESNGAGT